MILTICRHIFTILDFFLYSSQFYSSPYLGVPAIFQIYLKIFNIAIDQGNQKFCDISSVSSKSKHGKLFLTSTSSNHLGCFWNEKNFLIKNKNKICTRALNACPIFKQFWAEKLWALAYERDFRKIHFSGPQNEEYLATLDLKFIDSVDELHERGIHFHLDPLEILV